uniref:Uncharacterized protein n=1 Tax=Anguilla anguilla TaxID=7936 RepID=A0A0E9XD99_ANGAN
MDESLAIYCKCEEADYRERCDWSSMIEMTKLRMIRHGYCSPGAAERLSGLFLRTRKGRVPHRGPLFVELTAQRATAVRAVRSYRDK